MAVKLIVCIDPGVSFLFCHCKNYKKTSLFNKYQEMTDAKIHVNTMQLYLWLFLHT